jgi:apolipoprotein N-acyltransferase
LLKNRKKLRAVEFGRTVVIAATSGISAVVAPDGSVVRSSSLFTPATFVEDVAQRSSTTVAQRVGAGPEWVLTAVGVAVLIGCLAPVRRRLPRRVGGTR